LLSPFFTVVGNGLEPGLCGWAYSVNVHDDERVHTASIDDKSPESDSGLLKKEFSYSLSLAYIEIEGLGMVSFLPFLATFRASSSFSLTISL